MLGGYWNGDTVLYLYYFVKYLYYVLHCIVYMHSTVLLWLGIYKENVSTPYFGLLSTRTRYLHRTFACYLQGKVSTPYFGLLSTRKKVSTPYTFDFGMISA